MWQRVPHNKCNGVTAIVAQSVVVCMIALYNAFILCLLSLHIQTICVNEEKRSHSIVIKFTLWAPFTVCTLVTIGDTDIN